jgi:eukaryotic-like serine/threonine-protein kinase
MPEARSCARCGTPYQRDVPGDTCPVCDLRGALTLSPALQAEPPHTPPTTATGGRVRCFGDYELLEEIARGGMGVVYRARQRNLNRIVAVKMILVGQLASEAEVQRFRSEAEAAASLQHPNIVAIHEIGEHEGLQYFSMDLVEGQNLGQLVREHPLSAERAAGYVKTIAEAIQYAHERGILHRDLKPSNVLVDVFDQPRITDFGLAKSLAGDSGLTHTGQVLGTPSFIPPEQAAQDPGRVGPASDVYALGAILYSLITGRPPFMAATLPGTLDLVRHAEPIAPRLLVAGVPADVETICLKCLEKDAGRRYATARELAEELGRFLRGEPILARPVSRFEKTWRWCRRNPATAFFLVSFLVLNAAVGITITTANFRVAAARTRARQMAYSAEMILAQQAFQTRNMGYTHELLERQRPRKDQNLDLRGWEWRYLWRQCQDTNSVTLGRHESLVSVLAASPDGKWLLSGGYDRTAILWDLTTRREKLRLYHNTPVWGAAFSPTSDLLATLAEDGVVKLRALPGLTEREFQMDPGSALSLRYPSWSLAFAANGKRWGAASQGLVKIWSVGAGTLLEEQRLPDREGYLPAFSPDLSMIALSSPQPSILMWSTENHSEHARLQPGPKVYTYAQAFSPDGTLLATASTDNSVNLWETRTTHRIRLLNYHRSWVKGLAFSPDGRLLASAGFDQQVVLWEVSTGKILDVLAGHLNEVHSVVFLPDGKTLATGSKDQTVKLWDLTQRHDKFRTTELPGGLLGYGLSPDGRSLFLLEPTGRYTVRNVFPPNTEPLLSATDANVTAGAVAARGRRLALARREGTNGIIQIWDYRNGVFQPERQWTAHRGTIQQLAFSHDNRLLATAGADAQLVVWSTDSFQAQAITPLPTNTLLSISFSPDSQAWGLSFADGTGLVGHLNKPALLSRLNGHQYSVNYIAFSRNGRAATVSDDGTAKLWDLTDARRPRELATLGGPLTGMQTAVFSPDSKRLAAGGGVGEGELCLWDTATGLLVARLTGHRQRVMALAFTEDETLVSVSPDALITWSSVSAADAR